MFICMLSIISGKFESRKFLVFQHLSSIEQLFHTQLNLSVEKILNNLQSCSFWLYKSNRQHRNSTSIVPTGTVGPQGFSCSHLSGTPVTNLCEGWKMNRYVMSVLCVCDAIMLGRISMWCQCYLYVMPSSYVASRCDISVICLHLGGFRNFWEPLLKYENVVFNGEQKKRIICVRIR